MQIAHRRPRGSSTACRASGETVDALGPRPCPRREDGLLAELTAISLDVREEKTFSIRRSAARAEAAELAALCQADITLHWTPDAPFLQPHPLGLLTGMLDTMGAEDERAKTPAHRAVSTWPNRPRNGPGLRPPCHGPPRSTPIRMPRTSRTKPPGRWRR